MVTPLNIISTLLMCSFNIFSLLLSLGTYLSLLYFNCVLAPVIRTCILTDVFIGCNVALLILKVPFCCLCQLCCQTSFVDDDT